MLVTLSGIVTLVRLVQPENASSDAGDAVGDRDAGQAGSQNAQSPMLVTLSGIVTLVRLVQRRERRSPMVVTLLGMVTLVRLVQP